MVDVLTTVMCLSYVTGTYEICVNHHLGMHRVENIYDCSKGNLEETFYAKVNEDDVKHILTQEEWNTLLKESIVNVAYEVPYLFWERNCDGISCALMPNKCFPIDNIMFRDWQNGKFRLDRKSRFHKGDFDKDGVYFVRNK